MSTLHNHLAAQPVEPLIEPLTRREREILGLLAQGLTAPEISQSLTLAVSTVKWHLEHVYGKLGASSKREALTRAQALGLLKRNGAPSPADPPLTAAARHNLPLPVTRFFGRQADLAAIEERLTQWRFVTLTGPGGVGKTRLALRWAGDHLADFPHGAEFVDLAPLADPALLAQAVAAALAVRTEPGRPVMETLVAYLHERRVLLLLDNCEHLLEACAHLVHELLTTCLHLKVLATSRETLGTAGEAVYSVPSLPFPDPGHLPALDLLPDYAAIGLLVDRASAHLAGYRLTEHNAGDVARICHRLDGIPLALELAAGRLRHLDAATLASRLDDVFGLLTGGSRTALPRHQTLRATIDWSYNLLSLEERLLLQRLSVFAGGWTLDAAEAICSGEGLDAGAVLDALGALVDKSLVIASRPPGAAARYRLPETVRQYARDKLDAAGESPRLRTRHRDYFLAFAEAIVPKCGIQAGLTWATQVRPELENLRGALAWAFSEPAIASRVDAGPRLVLAMFTDNDAGTDLWSAAGEHLDWYARSIALCRGRADVAAQLLPRLLVGAAHILMVNEPHEALARSQEAVELSRQMGPEGRQTLKQSLYELGIACMILGDDDRARAAWLEVEALDLALEQEDPTPPDLDRRAKLAQRQAQKAFQQGDYETGQRHARESIGLYEAAGHAMDSYYMLMCVGNASLCANDGDAAYEYYVRARHVADDWGNAWARADSLNSLGATELWRGNIADALDHCQASLRLAVEVPDYNVVAHNFGLAAGILARQSQPASAAQISGAAHALYQRQGRKPWPEWSLDRLFPGWQDGADRAEIEAAFEAGQALTSEQAVAYALGVGSADRQRPN
jgi:predicted ATPase/DNA-binding CsgD family transcriptional regulator